MFYVWLNLKSKNKSCAKIIIVLVYAHVELLVILVITTTTVASGIASIMYVPDTLARLTTSDHSNDMW